MVQKNGNKDKEILNVAVNSAANLYNEYRKKWRTGLHNKCVIADKFILIYKEKMEVRMGKGTSLKFFNLTNSPQIRQSCLKIF